MVFSLINLVDERHGIRILLLEGGAELRNRIREIHW